MENFLREGVDLSGLGIYRGRTIAGDAHFFDDATTPSMIRNYLASTKVGGSMDVYHIVTYNFQNLLR